MRSGLLSFGIALILIGIIIYSIGNNGAQENRTLLGQIGRALLSSAPQQYQTYSDMESFGGIMVLVGIGLSSISK